MELGVDREALADSVRSGLTRLLAARDDGSLADLLAEHGVDLLTVHGSAARGEELPRDLDLGVLFADDDGNDVVGLLVALERLARCPVDVMDVRRASPVARARALAHDAVPVHEARPGLWARQQMAAATLEMELAPLRRRQLELMAAS